MLKTGLKKNTEAGMTQFGSWSSGNKTKYMHKPEPVPENTMYKILWYFEGHLDYPILAKDQA